tara:strand:+ start:319 stop:480 length:162 start_codon:yes stop_codon:yes gene_type:complete
VTDNIPKIKKNKNNNDISKNDSKKNLRLIRLKRLEKQLKSNILKRKKAINKNG